jgi:hypothetical protein
MLKLNEYRTGTGFQYEKSATVNFLKIKGIQINSGGCQTEPKSEV